VFYGDNAGLMAQRAKDIVTRLLVIEEAERFYQWLSAQLDPDLLDQATAGGNLPAGFTQTQVDTLRATYADMHALWQIVHGMTPQASYGITGSYDFLVNVKEVIGPL
jgi:hypothetical protein